MREFPAYQMEEPVSQDTTEPTFDRDAFLHLHRNLRGPLSESEITHSEKELSEKGVYPHFEDLEIEAKLGVNADIDAEELLLNLRKQLEHAGYSFLEASEITRHNYICYYCDEEGNKSKIIIRNDGDSGYQMKHKGKLFDKPKGDIRIKVEDKGEVKNSLQEAELELPEEMSRDPELILRVLKHKLTLSVSGEDGVVRYFRLSVDESSMPDSDEEKLCQIEIEYKGSNQEQEDSLSIVKDEMEKIVDNIQGIKRLDTASTKTKYKWGMKKLTQRD